MSKIGKAIEVINGSLKSALIQEFGDEACALLDRRILKVEGEIVRVYTNVLDTSSWHDGGIVAVKVEGGERLATPARVGIARDGTPGVVTPRNVANTLRAILKAVEYQKDIRKAYEAQKSQFSEIQALRSAMRDAVGIGVVRAVVNDYGSVLIEVNPSTKDPEAVSVIADKIRAILEENE